MAMRCAWRAIDRARTALLGLAAFALATACNSPRSNIDADPATWTTYANQVRPILVSRCVRCHSSSNPSGGYALDTYLAAVARRDDGTPRAALGNPRSLLLLAARGELSTHSAIPDSESGILQEWVVGSRLAPQPYTIHDKGWMNPGDFGQFHGLYLRRKVYDFSDCTQCHGTDLRGGITRVDCNSCHAAGVLACNTCHGDATSPAPPRDLNGIRTTSALGVGAHRAHVLDGRLHAAYSCSVCHITPRSATDEGHYQVGGTLLTGPVGVVLLAKPGATASWNRGSATCTNSYCHAPVDDANAQNQTPRWTQVGSGEAACGSCHGLPPANHTWPSFACETCHRPSYMAPRTLDPKMHANGTVDLSFQPGQCFGCHGDATSPAPPVDLLGRVDEALPSVGAHRAHLEARHHLRGPIPCSECHRVPSDVFAPGHLDQGGPPVPVFPPGADVGTLARTESATPFYTAANATCGSVYCHGGGTTLLRDTSGSVNRTPSWIAGTSQAACGACHGIPPSAPPHPSVSPDITQCANCHPSTMNRDGSIRLTIDPLTGLPTSTHINGRIDY